MVPIRKEKAFRYVKSNIGLSTIKTGYKKLAYYRYYTDNTHIKR